MWSKKEHVSHPRLCFHDIFFFLLIAVSNRKAPPPVPPRTTSKPLISVTLQSSTESAQDTYLDQQDRGSEANSQSGRSNSSDSLCSIRTGSLAKGTKPPPAPAPAATPAPTAGSVPPVPAPRDLPSSTTATATTTSSSTQSQNDSVSICVTLEQPPTAPKRKLSSIGIQVWTYNLWLDEVILHLKPPPWVYLMVSCCCFHRWIVFCQCYERNQYLWLHPSSSSLLEFKWRTEGRKFWCNSEL